MNKDEEKKKENPFDFSVIEDLKSSFQLKLKEKNHNLNQKENDEKINSDLEKFASMVDNEKREEIKEIAENEEEIKERLTDEIEEENFDILEEKKENENIINDNKIEKEEKPYLLEMLPNLYDDEDEIEGENKEKNEQKNEELNIKKEKAGKPLNISLNQKKVIIPKKKKDNFFEFLPSKIISEKEILNNDSFCKAFFLISFSKDCKINDELDFQADCNHPICNSLPSIDPEFIYFYQEESENKIDINELTASIIFPNGIKLCYEEDENKIKTIKNFINFFTDPKGNRNFAVTYHFYIRKNNTKFEQEQNMTPIQYEISKYKAMKEELNTEKEKEILKRLQILGKLGKKKYVYVPYCACLISKFPFFNEMEKCLESIVKALSDKNWNLNDLNNYISYIVRSIPVPPNKCSILFPLAYNYNLVEIKPCFFKEMNIAMDPFIILCNLSAENILILFKLLLFEQRILVVGKNINLVSQIIINFLHLLYPFQWNHPCIPILSQIMMKYFQSFLPFFYGVNTILFEYMINFPKGMFVLNLDKDKFELSDNYNLKSKFKYIKVSSYIEKHIKKFPNNLEEFILKELQRMKNSLLKNYNENNRLNINLEIKNLFLQIFAELLYDYKDFSNIVDDRPLFNKFLFAENKEKKYKEFYKEFSVTQLFMYFVTDNLTKTNTYFEKRLSDFKEVKKTEKSIDKYLKILLERFKDDYNNFSTLSKKYVIKPFFMKNFEEFEKKINSKNKQLNYFDIVKFLLDNCDKPKFNETNKNGILLENKRIFNGPIELTKDNDPEQLVIYYIPEQEKESINIIEEEEQNLKRVGFILSKDDYLKNRISKIIQYRDYGISNANQSLLHSELKELMEKIFNLEEEKLDNSDKATIINSFKIQYGKDYFLKMLSGCQKEKEKEIQNESFKFLSDIIFYLLTNSLAFENEQDLIYAVNVLKSCRHIKTTIKFKKNLISHKKVIILSDELYNKLNFYPLLNKRRFWEIWIEGDMTKNELNFKNLLKENPDEINIESKEFKSYEKHAYSLIYNLICIMIKMKINSTSIYSNIQYMSNEYLRNEGLKKRLKADILGQLRVYKNYYKRK